MTVTYTADVATSTFYNLHKLMFRWRGSIWQLVWHELLIWLLAYFALSVAYRNVMSENQRWFNSISIKC